MSNAQAALERPHRGPRVARSHPLPSRLLLRRSTGKHTQKLLRLHVIFESLAPVDEDDWHLLVETLSQHRIGVNVDELPTEVGCGFHLLQRLLDNMTQVAALARIKDHFMHLEIVRNISGLSRR